MTKLNQYCRFDSKVLFLTDVCNGADLSAGAVYIMEVSSLMHKKQCFKSSGLPAQCAEVGNMVETLILSGAMLTNCVEQDSIYLLISTCW